MEYNISEAELPTMVVRYENKLILRSVITGQHLFDLGSAPVWNAPPMMQEWQVYQQNVEMEHNKALEALVQFYPCDNVEASAPVRPVTVLPIVPPFSLVSASSGHKARAKSPVDEVDLPPCKVHRNYCCTYCNYCTQNPRLHLMHQRHAHGIRLSIHCCQHCQYASRYFQKLKRHIKMVHTTGSSTLIVKAQRQAARPSGVVPSTTTTTAKVAETQPEAQIRKVKSTKLSPRLATRNVAAKLLKPQATSTPTVTSTLKNPEAFFEAAYRNQLLQQQLNEQRLKDLTKAQSVAAHEQKLTSAISAAASQNLPDIKKPTIAHTTATITTMANKTNNVSKPNAVTDETEKKRLYSCRKCSYNTHIKSRYNKHVKYHSMPMIQCDKCQFRTTYKWNLTRHLRSHHGNGLYKCSICTFSAHMKQSLTSHELNHHSPPVGQFSKRNGKPHIRRRCRVGGSDLVQIQNVKVKTVAKQLDSSAATLPQAKTITNDNMETQNADMQYRESLKLLIKKDNAADSNSYSSHKMQQFTNHVINNATSEAIANTQPNETLNKSTPTTPSTVKSAASSTFVSLGDDNSSNNSFYSIDDNETATCSFTEKSTSTLQDLCMEHTVEPQRTQPENVPEKESELKNKSPKDSTTPQEDFPKQDFNDNFSADSESDSTSEDDSDDSSSCTMSANETVFNGVHIAYDSSSSEHENN